MSPPTPDANLVPFVTHRPLARAESRSGRMDYYEDEERYKGRQSIVGRYAPRFVGLTAWTSVEYAKIVSGHLLRPPFPFPCALCCATSPFR